MRTHVTPSSDLLVGDDVGDELMAFARSKNTHATSPTFLPPSLSTLLLSRLGLSSKTYPEGSCAFFMTRSHVPDTTQGKRAYDFVKKRSVLPRSTKGAFMAFTFVPGVGPDLLSGVLTPDDPSNNYPALSEFIKSIPPSKTSRTASEATAAKRKRKKRGKSQQDGRRRRKRQRPLVVIDDENDIAPKTPAEMMELLNPPLTQGEQRAKAHAKAEEMGALKARLPSLADIRVGPILPNNIQLTPRHYATLNPGTWLNDEVVNGFLSILEAHASTWWGPNVIVLVNSFFYPRLIAAATDEAKAKIIRKYTSSFAESDALIKVIIPLHLNANHWALVIINFTTSTLTYLDSLNPPNTVTKRVESRVEPLRSWVSTIRVDEGWTICVPTNPLPSQTNEDDCGVFAIAFAALTMGPDWDEASCITSSLPHPSSIPDLRKTLSHHLLEGRLLCGA